VVDPYQEKFPMIPAQTQH